LTEQTRDSLLAWLIHRGGSLDDYVFPAGQGQASTSAPASMPVLSANGSRRSGSAGQPTAPTACAGPRSRSSTSERAT
jgi:hypothetical protein